MYILFDLDSNLTIKSSYDACELWNEAFKNRDKNYNVFTISDLARLDK